MRIAVDLDGVLYPGEAYKGAHIFDEPPREGALEWLASLLEAGHDVVIFTSRLSQEPDHPKYEVADIDVVKVALFGWMSKHSTFHQEKLLFGRLRIANPSHGKIGCDIYIDDRAYRYDGGPFPSPAELEAVKPYWKKERAKMYMVRKDGHYWAGIDGWLGFGLGYQWSDLVTAERVMRSHGGEVVTIEEPE